MIIKPEIQKIIDNAEIFTSKMNGYFNFCNKKLEQEFFLKNLLQTLR